MSTQSSERLSPNEQLKIHLTTNRYSTGIQRLYMQLANRFLEYLKVQRLAIETVGVSEFEEFLGWERRSFRKRNRRVPRNSRQWRWRYTSAVHMLLRLVHGRWPVVVAPRNAIEEFHHELVHGYDIWMRDLRGLVSVTRTKRTMHALQFLASLGEQGNQEGLRQTTAREIDAYVQQRCVGLRRATIADCTGCLRSFLRYLHGSGRTALDLSGLVIGPRIYEYEHIPSALRPQEVERVLEFTRRDESSSGLRDYAIFMLLATYGLRAGEIVALRLEDIDWRKEVLHVRHSKPGTHSELPLLRLAAEAMLSYLESARPTSTHREVFLHVRAPYRPFTRGSSLTGLISARLRAAGITPLGRKGSHAFRHAKAVSLLRAAVPLKTIGDVLGHRSAHSTAVYLKLATEELRAVGLNIPNEVSP